jgi:hypothetical protein
MLRDLIVTNFALLLMTRSRLLLLDMEPIKKSLLQLSSDRQHATSAARSLDEYEEMHKKAEIGHAALAHRLMEEHSEAPILELQKQLKAAVEHSRRTLIALGFTAANVQGRIPTMSPRMDAERERLWAFIWSF